MAKTILEHFLGHFDKAREYKASSRKGNHGLEAGYQEHLIGPGIKDGYFYDGTAHRLFKANMSHFGIDENSFMDNDNKFVQAYERLYKDDFVKVLSGPTSEIKDAFRVFDKADIKVAWLTFSRVDAKLQGSQNHVKVESDLHGVGRVNEELTSDEIILKVNPYYVADALTLMQAVECHTVELYIRGTYLLIKGDRDMTYLIMGVR